MSDRLNREEMMEILARLPLKTLLRIRCVCKSWCSIITSEIFVKFCAKNLNNTHLLLMHSSLSRIQELFTLYFDNESFTMHTLNLENPPITNLGPYLTVLGSCNGLVCLADNVLTFDEHLYLWNPTIRKYISIIESDNFGYGGFWYQCAIGFGFDSANNDYKVVRIVGVSGGHEIESYSLREGYWRKVDVSGSIPEVYSESGHACVNGVIHWVSGGGGIDSESRHFIAAFNLGTEGISRMGLPPGLGRVRLSSMLRLGMFQDALCVFYNDFYARRVSIWVMREYGVVGSWTSVFNFDYSGGGIGKVIGLNRNGDVLLAKLGNMVLFDLRAQEFIFLGIRGHDDAFSVNTYTESLVLIDKVDGGHGEQAPSARWEAL